jgi:hypothetical protein
MLDEAVFTAGDLMTRDVAYVRMPRCWMPSS